MIRSRHEQCYEIKAHTVEELAWCDRIDARRSYNFALAEECTMRSNFLCEATPFQAPNLEPPDLVIDCCSTLAKVSVEKLLDPNLQVATIVALAGVCLLDGGLQVCDHRATLRIRDQLPATDTLRSHGGQEVLSSLARPGS